MLNLNSQEFLEHEPQKILEEVEAITKVHPYPNNDINWLGIAEIASLKIQTTSNTMSTSLLWAEIAVFIYDYMSSALTKKDTMRVSLECSAMFIKVYCITTFGVQKNDKLRDPQPIVEWFSSNAGISLDEASFQSKQWIKLPKEQIIALRHIKNRLNVIKELYKNDNIPLDSLQSIENWIAIWPELP